MIAWRTSPEARAEAAFIDPGIVVTNPGIVVIDPYIGVAPDLDVDARLRLLVPSLHADEEMMHDPGPRAPRPAPQSEPPNQ